MNRKQISSRMRKIEEEYPVLLHNPKGFAVPVTVTVVLIISAVVFSFWFTFVTANNRISQPDSDRYYSDGSEDQAISSEWQSYYSALIAETLNVGIIVIPVSIGFSAVNGVTMILLRKRQRKTWRSNFDAIPDKIASEYFNLKDDYKKCALKESGDRCSCKDCVSCISVSDGSKIKYNCKIYGYGAFDAFSCDDFERNK